MHRTKIQTVIEYIFYEFLVSGNLSKYNELVESNVEVHNLSHQKALFPVYLQGRRYAKRLDAENAKAFQVDQIEISDLLIDKRKAFVRWSFAGIHKNNFFYLPASHRSFHLTGHTYYQFSDAGKISKVWQAWDLWSLVQQISIQNSEITDHELLALSRLSPKEIECMKYLLQGKTAKETAEQMQISFRTVEYYFENIKDKLSCSTKRELFVYANYLCTS